MLLAFEKFSYLFLLLPLAWQPEGQETMELNQDRQASICNLPAVTHQPNHDFHTSLAEMQYNPEAKSFEISLRLFTDDFELALGQMQQVKSYSLDKSERHEPLIKDFIHKHFYLVNAKNQKLAYKYYGREFEADVTLLYFEIPVKKNLQDYQLRNSVFTNLFDDQVNIVNVKYFKTKKTLLFRPSQTKKVLALD